MDAFDPAFPRPIKWSTGENRFDDRDKNPTTMSLFIPLDSVAAFANYLMNLADDDARHKTAKIWDYETKSELEVPGIYVNGKGRDGRDGSFGTINPKAVRLAVATPQEMPF